MHENEIAAKVVDAAVEVHRELGGPGLLEDVCEEALAEELKSRGLFVERQVPVPIVYKGKPSALHCGWISGLRSWYWSTTKR